LAPIVPNVTIWPQRRGHIRRFIDNIGPSIIRKVDVDIRRVDALDEKAFANRSGWVIDIQKSQAGNNGISGRAARYTGRLFSWPYRTKSPTMRK
jgi:hypothetical protein